MEPLDREIAKALDERPLPKGPAWVLMVGSDHDSIAHVLPLLEARKHRCTQVQRLGEARAALARRRWDVILLSPRLPDGSGLDLLRTVQKTSSSTKIILLTSEPTPQTLVDAMRGGAVDMIDTASAAIDGVAILERLDAAILKSRVDWQREERLIRLKRICEELNVARREVTEQVDVLCNDLAAAYEDIGTQMSDVAMATEFRTLVKQELDVEDLLRTSLEYLLTKTGATNAAVFLADHDQNFGLGAYVNYDCPRDTVT
ncbi:MAG: response regulator, partial [Planctomycetota bacterium]